MVDSVVGWLLFVIDEALRSVLVQDGNNDNTDIIIIIIIKGSVTRDTICFLLWGR